MNGAVTVKSLPTCGVFTATPWHLLLPWKLAWSPEEGVTGAGLWIESLAHEVEQLAVRLGFAFSTRSSAAGQSWEKESVCPTQTHHLALPASAGPSAAASLCQGREGDVPSPLSLRRDTQTGAAAIPKEAAYRFIFQVHSMGFGLEGSFGFCGGNCVSALLGCSF